LAAWWQRDRLDLDLGHALPGRDADLVGGGRRQVDDAALHVRTAVLDRHRRALAGLEVGDLGFGAERQRLARGVVVVRVHAVAVGHLAAGEAVRIDRRRADALASGAVEPGR